jgi:hypothetical protein
MNILVIQGSPHKDGNTATITHQLMEGLTAFPLKLSAAYRLGIRLRACF